MRQTVQLELIEQTTFVRGNENLDIQIRAVDAPADATVDLRIMPKLENRDAFADTVAGTVTGTEIAGTSHPLGELLNPQGNAALSYPLSGDQFGPEEYGVYPVHIVLADGAGETLSSLVSYMVVLPGENSDFLPLNVAVVMDFGAPPALQPDGNTVLSDEARTNLNQRLDVLDGVTTPLSIAPVPETLDAIAETGAQSPSSDPSFDQVKAALAPPREILARPYVDLDYSAMAAAGMLHHVPFENDQGARVSRLRLEREPAGNIWLPTSVTEAEATTARELGVPFAIVPSHNIASVTGESDTAALRGPVRLIEDGPLVLTADDTLSARLIGQEGRLDAQRFLAELALIWSLSPANERAVIVRIPDQSPLDPQLVQNALTGLDQGQVAGMFQPKTAKDLFDRLPPIGGEQPEVAELAPDESTGVDLNGLAPAFEDSQRLISGLAGMLDNHEQVAKLQHSLLIAPGARTPPELRQAYLEQASVMRDQMVSAINAPQTFRITLTDRTGEVPISIDNSSNQTVHVQVRLSSSQLKFPDGNVIDVKVPPGGHHFNVKVRTRASGAFPMRISVTSPDGSIALDRTTFTIRSTTISGAGLILSIGAGLFLAIWWARHWRTARRSARLIQTHPSAAGARQLEFRRSPSEDITSRGTY